VGADFKLGPDFGVGFGWLWWMDWVLVINWAGTSHC